MVGTDLVLKIYSPALRCHPKSVSVTTWRERKKIKVKTRKICIFLITSLIITSYGFAFEADF